MLSLIDKIKYLNFTTGLSDSDLIVAVEEELASERKETANRVIDYVQTIVELDLEEVDILLDELRRGYD